MTFIKQMWKAWQWGIGRTVVATIAAHGNSVSVGLCQGFSAVLLPQLLQPQSDISISEDQASWVASLGVISNPMGAVLAGILMELVGRKTTIQLATLPYLVGWLTIALSDSFAMLCAGRFVSGLAVGMASASYVYVAEVSASAHRGVLSALGPVLVSLGVLLVYVMGALAPWQYVAAGCALLAVASCAATCVMPESPAWLVGRHRLTDAEHAISWLRPEPNVAALEFKELVQAQSQSQSQGAGQSACGNWQISTLCSASLWRPFLILVVLFAFQEGSGIYVILYYAVSLFKEVGTELNEYVASIVVAVMRLLMSIVGAVLMKSVARKTLLIVSALGMSMAMAVAGTSEHMWPGRGSWVPLACMLAHVCLSMVGFLQIPWVMTAELFPLRARGIMGGLVSSVAHLFVFASVKTYPNVRAQLGLDGTLWLFAGAAASGAVYAACLLPETNGKSLMEIQITLNKKRDSEVTNSSKGVVGIGNSCPNVENVFVVNFSSLDSASRKEHHPSGNGASDQTMQMQGNVFPRNVFISADNRVS